ncbi:MAG: alpha/beta fold hydrolase [Thermoleophilaceae bacterium]|nr:alpha/beta fold hydrolase [Thermoleophilaceae bacterium]
MRTARVVLLAVGLLVSALAPEAAAAACPDGLPAKTACTTIRVPLDRSRAVPGEVPLFVARVPATGRRRGTLALLAGGPGDGPSWYFTARRHLADFRAARRTHDLLIVDGRGTGRSRPLDCPGAAACAAALGPARGRYTSADVAADLDVVRARLGLRRLSLYGISYGTFEAQTYARAYPSRVARLVLDSTVDPLIDADPWRLAKTRAVPSALRAVCRRRACRAFTRDPWADFVKLVDGLERRTLPGRRFDERGRPQPLDLSAVDVALALSAADINSDLRAELPGAIDAALRGDAAPLARLAEVAAEPAPASPGQHSDGRFVATACQEQGVPWGRSTPPAERTEEAGRRLALLPDDAFRPFSKEYGGLVYSSLFFECEAWPLTAGTAPARGPLPRVPALLLHGDTDVRTPLSGARRVARSVPGARLVVIRGAGHNVLREGGSRCPQRLVGDFLAGRRLPRCSRASSFRALPPPPLRAGPGAARLTIADARRQALMRIDQVRGLVRRVRFGGLRGGWAEAGPRRIRLHAYEFVPGVPVTRTVARR